MKQRFIFILVILFYHGISTAQTIFQNTYTGSGTIAGTFVEPTASGMIVAGGTLSIPTDAILMKTDLSGNVSWAKSYGGSGDEVFNVVRETSDGGMIAAGYTTSSGAGGKDALVVKTDASGTVSWANTYGTIDDEMIFDIIQTAEGGYAFTGDAQKILAGSPGAIYLAKLSSTGTETWSKMWGNGSGNEGRNVIQTFDDGFMVGGRADNGFFSFIKTDASGNIDFARASKSMTLQSVAFRQMVTTLDGGYAVVGWGPNTSNDGIIAFEKIDASGVVEFAKTYNPDVSAPDEAFGIALNGSGFTIFGFIGNFQSLYILNLSSTGVATDGTESTAINNGSAPSFAIASLSDGTLGAAGTNGQDLILLKSQESGYTSCSDVTIAAVEDEPSFFDNDITNWTSSGTISMASASITGTTVSLTSTTLCSIVGVQNNDKVNDLTVYPNPVSGVLTMDISNLAYSDELTIDIYNIIGELMESVLIDEGSKLVQVSTSTYGQGIYLIKTRGPKDSSLVKIIVE